MDQRQLPPLNDATPFIRYIAFHNRHDPALYRPFVISGVKVGLVRNDLCRILSRFPNYIKISDDRILLRDAETPEAASLMLARLTREMAAEGAFLLRGEDYAVTAEWGEPALATIDRGATTFFGTRSFGVHVNGIVMKQNEMHLWIGHRAMDRGVAPGKLDNLVGGGMPAGLTAMQTVIKEAWEEAGLDESIARIATPVGAIRYTQDTETGVKRDTLFGYDLYMPDGLVPANQDGEVDRFELMPIAEIAALVRDTDSFKANCNLVIIDLLIRHGYLTPDMPGYVELTWGLK